MIAAIWILTLLGLALWTALAAGLHMLLAADPAWLSAFGEWLARIPGSGWISDMWPDWHRITMWLLKGLQDMLRWAGAVAIWVLWIIWAAATGLALLAAGALHLMARGYQKATAMAQQAAQQAAQHAAHPAAQKSAP